MRCKNFKHKAMLFLVLSGWFTCLVLLLSKLHSVLFWSGSPSSLCSSLACSPSSSGLASFLCFMRLFWNQILICLSVS